MTALKGLVEAVVLFVIGMLVAAVAALVWVNTGGGGYLDRLGVSMLIAGALLAASGDLTLTKLSTHETFAWFGVGPERQEAGGGRVLTGVGIFLFVAVPLIIVGGVLAS